MAGKNGYEPSVGEINGSHKQFPFLLAGVNGAIVEFDLFGISLQRVQDGAFRCILRGAFKAGPNAGVRLVAFTNAECSASCLLYAERALATGSIRWQIDKYAPGSGGNAASKGQAGQLTLIK